VTFLHCNRAMLDALGNDEELARAQANVAISKLNG
jgi:hypothetical protein